MDVILRILGLATGKSTDRLIELLEKIGVLDSTLKPLADEWIATLRGAASADNLTALLQALPAEIAKISKLELDPRDHPSDW